MVGKPIDLTGQKFGRLTALMISKHGEPIKWLCRCECGNEKEVRAGALRNGATKSCGCLNKEIISTHGMTKTPEYKTWISMVNRCTNKNNKAYEYYGGRGITVCDRWRKFENFYKDMGKRPSDKHSLDRTDNNKGYSPDNCKWVTINQQVRNQRLLKRNKSGYKGVSWSDERRKWCVQISANGKSINIGRFNEIEDAVQARKQAELKYWGKSS